jgi:hypothetical protein
MPTQSGLKNYAIIPSTHLRVTWFRTLVSKIIDMQRSYADPTCAELLGMALLHAGHRSRQLWLVMIRGLHAIIFDSDTALIVFSRFTVELYQRSRYLIK